MAYLHLLVPVVLLALFIQSGETVRCWTCSSDVNPTCKDRLKAGKIGQVKLENCDANIGKTGQALAKSVCKKQEKKINGRDVVIRGCSWKRTDDNTKSCPLSKQTVPDEVTTFCETCDFDGCNGR